MVLKSPAEPLGSSADGPIRGAARVNGNSAAVPRPNVGGARAVPDAKHIRRRKRHGPPAAGRLRPFESQT
jgi:hypothetical protein